ncbi:hypothetical protein HPB49_022044 [Dermacentor silvarum]|uniref:Uncharacterized protein n=1 Tax=Dermacentor silvarum TaxID=543639 RepID=A0ACB8E2N0_DERSI|nr:hypothetical protein HPB49_022044 [Dermacentor silvarum]
MLVTILLVTTTTLASSIEAGAGRPTLRRTSSNRHKLPGPEVIMRARVKPSLSPPQSHLDFTPSHFPRTILWDRLSRSPASPAKACSRCISSGSKTADRCRFRDTKPTPKWSPRRLSLLTVIDVGAEDVGNYTCTATNAAGSDGFTAELAVAEATKLQPVYIAKDHPLLETLVVSCIAIRGSQPLKFAWFKDGHPLNEGTRAMPRSLTDTLSTLTIPKVTAADVATIRAAYPMRSGATATAPTARHSAYTHTTAVAVSRADHHECNRSPFRRTSTPARRSASRASLRSDGNPFASTGNTTAGFLANGARKHSRVVVDNIVTMTIERVTAEDVGNYTCTVTNEFGSDSAIYGCVDSGSRPRIAQLARRCTRCTTQCCAAFDMAYQPSLLLLFFGAQYLVLCKSADTGRPLIMPFSFPRTPCSDRKPQSRASSQEARSLSFRVDARLEPNRQHPRRHVKVLTENVAALTVEAATAEDVGTTRARFRTPQERELHRRSPVEGQPWVAFFLKITRFRSAAMIMPISLANNIALGEKILLTCAVTRERHRSKFAGLTKAGPLQTRRTIRRSLTGSIATLTIEKVTAEDVWKLHLLRQQRRWQGQLQRR